MANGIIGVSGNMLKLNLNRIESTNPKCLEYGKYQVKIEP